jgi:hypothetical protein
MRQSVEPAEKNCLNVTVRFPKLGALSSIIARVRRVPAAAVADLVAAGLSPYTASISLANLSHRAIISPRYFVSLGVVVSDRSIR